MNLLAAGGAVILMAVHHGDRIAAKGILPADDSGSVEYVLRLAPKGGAQYDCRVAFDEWAAAPLGGRYKCDGRRADVR